MRVSGLLLFLALAAGCGGTSDEPRQLTESSQQQQAPVRPEEHPPAQSSAQPHPGNLAPQRPTGTSGTTAKDSPQPSEPGIASPATANQTAVALADFKKRVDAYADLHDDLAKGAAKQRQSADPAKLNQAEAALATKVQGARVHAKQGDIFTPAVRPIFRRLLAPELKGADGRDTRAVLKDDAPAAGTVPFKVNAKYPEAQPLPTVPANVLATLPPLPEPLEYRIVGQHLILLDTASDLIVDYIPNAITK